jgi:8-oxo-dGTP pyrophosphatase MutT (NUDIX family)
MNTFQSTRFRKKVVLYPTWGDRLLVFFEPDFPDVAIQVPGGTIYDHEMPVAAARREFTEETGLQPPPHLGWLGRRRYESDREGIHHVHDREFFHLVLEGNFSESWETIEATPDGGGPPIRFGLFWVPVRAGPLNLFGGLDALLPKVRQLLAGKK